MADDDAASALRKHLGLDVARRGWWLTHRTATEAEFLARNGPDLFEYVRFEQRADGSWQWNGEGDCEMQFQAPGLFTLPWALDEATLLDADTSVIRAIVLDRCNREAMPALIQRPIVRIGADRVLVIITANPDAALPAGRRDGHAARPLGRRSGILLEPMCAPAPLEVEFDLGEPLGDRLLLDGSRWPARDPRQPLPPWQG